MAEPGEIVTPLCVDDKAQFERDVLIKDIIARGNVVRFKNVITGIVKDVDAWNPNGHGDLTAFRQNGGRTPLVCWQAIEYKLSEVTKDIPLPPL